MSAFIDGCEHQVQTFEYVLQQSSTMFVLHITDSIYVIDRGRDAQRLRTPAVN